jgi:hypothetical protein
MKVEQALELGLCKFCNSYQAIKKEWQCVATRLPSLNYRNTKTGNCALTATEIQERRKDGRVK